MQYGKKVTIIWKKELKNSVKFDVKVNGQEMGIISRGGQLEFYTGDGGLNILFSPKAPKWFGWKALSVTAATGIEDSIVITLGVQYESGTIFGKLGDAANYKNQLHTIEMTGLVNYTEEHLKKW